MDANSLAAVISGCAALIALVVGLVLKGDIKRNERTAQVVAANTKPISNGFANTVTTKLDTLISEVSYLKGVQDTLSSVLFSHSETIGSNTAMIENVQLEQRRQAQEIERLRGHHREEVSGG